MDFQPQMKSFLETGTPLPFFMAYPDYPLFGSNKERYGEKTDQDFEYLRRTYPAMLGKWQRRVEEILDKMDYDGSMIYDEFPDKMTLQNLSEAVARVLALEGKKDDPSEPADAGDSLEDAYLQGLAQVLVCNDVYRRRQKRKQEANGRITKCFGNRIE